MVIDLPVCKLCKVAPEQFRDGHDGFEGAICANQKCPLFNVEMSHEEWQTLHGESVGDMKEQRDLLAKELLKAVQFRFSSDSPGVQLAKRISGEGV